MGNYKKFDSVFLNLREASRPPVQIYKSDKWYIKEKIFYLKNLGTLFV